MLKTDPRYTLHVDVAHPLPVIPKRNVRYATPRVRLAWSTSTTNTARNCFCRLRWVRYLFGRPVETSEPTKKRRPYRTTRRKSAPIQSIAEVPGGRCSRHGRAQGVYGLDDSKGR